MKNFLRTMTVADSHYDEGSRFEECVAVHDWIADEADRLDVDLLIHTGDVFERKSTPAERGAFARWLIRVARRRPVVIVRGNHDEDGDLPIFSLLGTKWPVVVVEGCERITVETPSFTVDVACLAWPKKAELLAATGASGQDAEALAKEALRAAVRGLNLDRDPGRAVIFAAHAMVDGSMTSTGQPLIGASMELGLTDLAAVNADLYVLGHIHLGQEWSINGAPVIYPGSPRRTAFGELEAKGVTIADVEFQSSELNWRCAKHWLAETPCSPMVLIESEWDGENFTNEHESLAASVAGAEIRFRFSVDSDQREAAKARAKDAETAWLAAGAKSVKVEVVVRSKALARAPEIAEAKTTEGKLAALWESRGVEVEGHRRARVLGMLQRIEAEERAS